MTAQEAAKKQTRFYRWLAAIFAAGGLTALGGLYFDDLKVAATSAGGGGIVLSVLGFLADWYGKKAGTAAGAAVGASVSKDVADEVVERIFRRFGGLEEKIVQSDKRRDEMHAENRNDNRMMVAEVHEIKERLDDTEGKIDHLGEAVKSLKPGWEMPQIKKQPKPQ